MKRIFLCVMAVLILSAFVNAEGTKSESSNPDVLKETFEKMLNKLATERQEYSETPKESIKNVMHAANFMLMQ